MLFSGLRIFKVSYIVELRTAHIMYQANSYMFQVNIQIHTMFTLHKPVYVIKQSPTFKHMYVRAKLKIICFAVKGVTLWNSFAISLIYCRNVDCLKNICR